MCQNWIWTVLTVLAAFTSVPLAAIALVQSRRAVQASIPEPQIQLVYQEFYAVRMHPKDERQFAILGVKTRDGKFQAEASFSVRELEDIVKKHRQMEPLTNSVTFDPPAVLVLIRSEINPGGELNVLIGSRANRSIRKWIAFYH